MLLSITDVPPTLLKPTAPPSEKPGGDVLFSLLVVPGTAPVKVGENVKSIDIPMTMKLAQDGGGEVVNYYSLRILSIAHFSVSRMY